MKNVLFSVLILMLVLPAFAPWLPHGAIHALHDHHTSHHSANHHDHGHPEHSHDHDEPTFVHHPIHFDVVTYFNDYLHVDLQAPTKLVLKAIQSNNQKIDYPVIAIAPTLVFQTASINSRAPPDIRRLRSEKIPVYLSTARLRI